MLGMKTIRQAVKDWSARIAWEDTEILLAHVLKKDRAWLIGHGTDLLKTSDQRKFDQLAQRRVGHEPLAYLTGVKSFYGRDFLVNAHVLIPRPETEVMIDEAVKLIDEPSHTLIWDVGTGSGAIAISCAKKQSKLKIIASDISRHALSLAKKNAQRQKAKITFIQADLFSQKITSLLRREREKKLIILANLPYLPFSDKKVLTLDVIKHEPSLALFTKENGMFLNKKLLKQLATLNRSMTVLLEFDPPQVRVLKKYAQALFPNAKTTILKDQFGRKRFLKIV